MKDTKSLTKSLISFLILDTDQAPWNQATRWEETKELKKFQSRTQFKGNPRERELLFKMWDFWSNTLKMQAV